MRVRIVTLAVAAGILSTASGLYGAEEPSVPLTYLQQRAERLGTVQSPSAMPGQWQQRRNQHARAGDAAGFPHREPMKAATVFQRQDGDLVLEEVIYHWSGDTYAAGHVIRTKQGPSRRPALVICPGQLAHYTWLGYRQFVDRVAKAGWIVFFLEDPRIGRRSGADAGLETLASASGMPLDSVQVFDALRGLDYLVTRSDVAPGQIGIAGFGPGAIHAWIASICEKRLQFAVLGVGGKLHGLCEHARLDATCPAGAASDPAVYLPLVDAMIAKLLPSLEPSTALPLPCGKPEHPQFSMICYFQGRIAAQSKGFAKAMAAASDWAAYRLNIDTWLSESCGTKGMRARAAIAVGTSTTDGQVVEKIRLRLDDGLECPAILAHRAGSATGKQPAVIVSHDSSLAAKAPEIQATIQRLTALGYWVLVPEHISTHPESLRKIDLAELPQFFAAAERARLSPLGLRVAENLAAFDYLAGRKEIDAARIVVGGSGIGAIDAALAAVLQPRIAGVAAVNVTTLRDWACTVAPEEIAFVREAPCLPGMLQVTDLDYLLASLAPRPLVVARLKSGWPKSGFDQVAATAAAAYRLAGKEQEFTSVGLRESLDERIARAPDGAAKQALAVAQAILPPPPIPGIVGTREGLCSRDTMDSASGVVWVLGSVGGEDQEFCDGGYAVDSWSFFNDNAAAEQGRAITPLVFKKEGDAFKLTGIGKTRINTGGGLQTFPFEAVHGSNQVAAGYFFGFFTGDSAGKPNAGVVEYGDDPQQSMIILTLDGGLDNQKISLGQSYRENSRWPRGYSIQAISKRK